MTDATPRRMSLSAQKSMDYYVNASQQLNDQTEHVGLNAMRLSAQAHFIQQGFPTRRDEDWQYTPLTQFLQSEFTLDGQSQLQGVDLSQWMPSFKAIRLVFVDGRFCDSYSDDISDLPKGLMIELTTDLLESSGDAEHVMFDSSCYPANAFTHLNSMLMSQGLVIDVDDRAAIELPIFVLHIHTQTNQLCVLSNRVTLGENAELTLIERTVALDGVVNSFGNTVSQISLGESARFNQRCVQELPDASFYFCHQFISQSARSVLNTLAINVGGLVSRHENHVTLAGEHCETNQNSVCYADGKQVVDSRTSTLHDVPHGTSSQLHKYVLAGQSRGVFNGFIGVAKDAQKTDGNMDNKNLLLSNDARMSTKPQLEIFADDVKCTHGSASGQLDKDQIFYLQARGIKRPDAVNLIVEAFLLEPLEMVTNFEHKRWFAQVVKQYL